MRDFAVGDLYVSHDVRGESAQASAQHNPREGLLIPTRLDVSFRFLNLLEQSRHCGVPAAVRTDTGTVYEDRVTGPPHACYPTNTPPWNAGSNASNSRICASVVPLNARTLPEPGPAAARMSTLPSESRSATATRTPSSAMLKGAKSPL